MSLAPILRQTKSPNITELEKKGDVSALINLLSHRDYLIRNGASDALGRIGAPAIDRISNRAARGRIRERLGVMEALARIRDPRCIPRIRNILESDPRDDMRWMAAITLGEVGGPSEFQILEGALKDKSKYVRFGAAKALEKLQWIPPDHAWEVRFRVALQDWSSIPGLPAVPVNVLEEYVDDPDPRVREFVVFLLGYLEVPVDERVCEKILKDPEPRVRWKASLALPQCNVSSMSLPAGMFRRRREKKSVYIAAFLNFFFLGMGYNYLEKWWGFLLFQIMVNTITILTLLLGTFLPYLFSFAISSIAVVHTWRMMKGLPDI